MSTLLILTCRYSRSIRFNLRHLRDFGFGRRFQDLEVTINEQILDLLDLIKFGPKYSHEEKYCKSGGLQILTPFIFMPFAANSFFHIICNSSVSREHSQNLYKAVEGVSVFQREASIRESLRIDTLVPTDVPHMALEEAEIMGYKVPKVR